jgi:hypothetical protein
LISFYILIFILLKWSLREGVAKVAPSNFGVFLLEVGGDSKAHDLSKNTKIAGTTLRRLTAFL